MSWASREFHTALFLFTLQGYIKESSWSSSSRASQSQIHSRKRRMLPPKTLTYAVFDRDFHFYSHEWRALGEGDGPDGEGEVARIALARANEVGAVKATLLEKLLRIHARQMRVEPPANNPSHISTDSNRDDEQFPCHPKTREKQAPLRPQKSRNDTYFRVPIAVGSRARN